MFIKKFVFSEFETIVFGDGSFKLGFAINGQIPGPPIVVFEGQTVCCTFRIRK